MKVARPSSTRASETERRFLLPKINSAQASVSSVGREAVFLLLGLVLSAQAAFSQNVTASIGVGNSPAAVAVNPVTGTLYVVNSASDSVSVINVATNTVTATVSTGTSPVALAVNPVSNMIYVVNNGSNNITVINGATNAASTVTDPNAIGPTAVALNPLTNVVYVANSQSNNLTVINGAGNTVAATVGVGSNPTAVVVSPATNMVYVANQQGNTVSVVNGANNAVAATVGVGTNPVSLAVDTATNAIYAVNNGSNNLTVINGASNMVVATVNTGTSPAAVTVDPVTDRVYVANQGSSNVSVINGANNTVTATVLVGNSPVAVAADPTTDQIYVVNSASNNLTVIDGISNATTTIADSNAIAPVAVAVDPVTDTVVVANNGSANISVVSGESNVVTATLTTSTNPVAVGLNTVTNTVYVANSASSTVTVINGSTNTVTATVNTGTNPVAIAVNPASNMVYVANKGSNTVTVIDGSNNSVAATVNVGSNPVAVAVNPVINVVYVANNGSGSVTVINGANNSVATTVGVGTAPVAVAANPATGLVYVANNGSDNVTVFDPVVSSNVTITDLAASRPVALIVDSLTNKIYVANSYSDNVSVIDGTSDLVVATINVGDTPIALDLNPITNKIYITNSGSNNVSVIDGTALAVVATVAAGTAPSAVSVNTTSNRIYVANNGNNSTDFGSVTVIDGAGNISVTVTDSNANQPYALAANPLTDEIYVANNLSSNTSVITGEPIHSNPIVTSIGALSGNQTSNETPTFKFAATNGLNAGPVDELLFQMDTWLGSWTAATSTTPGNFKGTTAMLLPGFHTIYAYATEGEEATSTVSGAQSSPLIGTIAAYGFLVATPLADVSPSALNFGNQQVGTQSSSQTVVLGNPGSAALTFSYAVSPGDFSEGQGDTCSSMGGQLAPKASCTIFVVFTPSNSGPETATLTVADNANNISGSTQTVSLSGTGTTTSFTLNVAEAGTGTGTVMSSPAGINCPSVTCAASFSAGTSVTLTAAPNAGSTFVGWSGACSGRGSCTVTMNSNQAVTATFKLSASTSCSGTTDNWIGGASGNWSNPNNWSNGVPNSSSVNVCINDGNSTPSAVTLDVTVSVGTLTIDPGSSLTISNNIQLFADGNISNAGQIMLNAAANYAQLVIAGTVSLTGGGSVILSTTGAGFALIDQSGGQTLTNVDNVIQGTGYIGWNGLTVVNQAGGIINANVPGGSSPLVLDTPNLTNQGLLEAASGGLLQLQNNFNNGGGRILSTGSGSSAQFINATVRGGTLTSSGGGALGVAANAQVSLDGSSQGTLTIVGTYTGTNNSITYVTGTINNTGVMQVNATANNTQLAMYGTTSLTGGGTVTLSTSGAGLALIDESGGQTLTNVNNTIQGAGYIGVNGLTVVNQAGGTINANAASTVGPLVVNPSSLTNQGLLEATAGGTLQIETGCNNAGGSILATGSNSAVQLISATIHGGRLTSANSGVLGAPASATATLDGSTQGTLTIAGTYTAANNSITYMAGTIDNTGAIQVNAVANNTQLAMYGPVSLTGAGTVTLTTSSTGLALIDESGGQTLTNVNNTVQGSGYIGVNGLTVVNQGTIDANLPAVGPLVINPHALTNEGLLEATAGATLQLNGSTFNNTGGTISASGAGSTMQFANGAVIQSGTLATSGGGTLGAAVGNSLTLDGSSHGRLTIAGTYTAADASITYVLGTINNTGNIQVNAVADNTYLAIASSVSLIGNGTVSLSTTGAGLAVIDESGGQTLTNVDNTLQGTGYIGWNNLSLINQGTINANVAANTLVLDPAGFTNQGLLEASAGGTLALTGSTINNRTGTIQVNGATSTVQFVSGAVIQGGTVASINKGVLTIPTGNFITFDGSSQGTFTLAGTYVGTNNTTTYLKGTINNTGVIQLNAAANNTYLTPAGAVSLTGAGVVTMSTTGAGGVAIINESGGQTLTNVNNTLQGTGVIGSNGLSLVNQSGGIIAANVAGAANSLIVNPGGFTNQGLMEATVGGTLALSGSTLANGTGTISVVGATSSVQVENGVTIQGGTLSGTQGGAFTNPIGSSITLDGSTSQGTLSIAGNFVGANGSITYLKGTINNTGAIQLNAVANATYLAIAGTTSLTGSGTVTLSTTGTGQAIIDQSGGQTLTNVNNTLQGMGVIGSDGLTVINQAGGVVNANAASPLLVNTGLFTNQGLLEATAGGTLQLQNGFNNSGGNILATGSGSAVQLISATVRGGTLTSASGGVLGAPVNTTATLDGGSEGALTIAGTYTVANNSVTYLSAGTINNTGTIQINAAANNTFLSVAGTVSLTGNGAVVLTETSAGGTAIINQSGGQTLTNVNNSLQGAGVIGSDGLSVINQGTINANLPAEGTLTLNPGGFTNQGLLEATVGGTLVLSSSTISNGAGTIKVSGASSAVQFVNGATIQGGTMSTASGGVLTIPSGNAITLDGSTTQGALTIAGNYVGADNTITYLKGTINNTGTIQINEAGHNTFLSVAGTTSLTGAGTVTLKTTAAGAAAIINQSGGQTLTNMNNVLQGAGVIGSNGLSVINQGTIDANLPAEGTLTLNPGGFTNQGLLEATAGGTLVLSNSTIANGAGTIGVNGASSVVQFVNGAAIQGGTLTTANSGLLTIPSGTNITLDGSTNQGAVNITGTYVGANNTTTYQKGIINNVGAIQINETANNTFLTVAATTSLTGAGTVTLSTGGPGGTAIINQSGGQTLTNVGNMLQGSGVIGSNGLTVINQGIINANASSSLMLNPNALTNQGVLEATGSGMLQVSTTVNNAGGSIVANGAAAAVQFANGLTIQGGTVNGISGGFAGSSSGNTLTLDGTSSAVSIASGGTYTVGNNSTTNILGTINNNGTVLLDSTGNTTVLGAPSGAMLTGTGAVMMTNGANVISGSSLVNVGSTIVDSVSFNVTSYTQNSGLFQVTATGNASPVAFNLNGGTAQVDGTMSASKGVNVTGGTLSGNGIIASNVSMAGMTQAGDIPNPGILTVGSNGVGSYAQTSAGAYDVVIGGLTAGTQYSQLNVPPSASLGGTLNVSLINGFTPAAGNQFVILTAGSLSGQFVTTNLPALPPNLSWMVNYSSTQVVLSVMSSNSNFTLTVTTLGTGNGTVTDNLQQIDCTDTNGVQSGVCSASYAPGTTVNLTATPQQPTTFGGWGGACAGTDGCSVLMNANQAVTASFVPPPVTMSAPFTCPGGVFPCQNVTAPPAVFNCPSGKNPCPDPNAHSLTLTAPRVNVPFTMTVAATEVPMSQADGDCQSGQTPRTDFDCRFTSFFSFETLANGDVIVPACDAYSNGNCVFYSVYFGSPGLEPPDGDYEGPIAWSIAWNNTAFLPNPNYPYQINNPRLYDDPDEEVSRTAPYGTNCNTPMLINGNPTNPPIYCQFVFDITTYFDPNQPPDAGIGGKTKHFNDVVVAFPLTIAAPSLSITKTADNPIVNAGNPIGYTITMSNGAAPGTGTATNAMLNDPLPAGTNVNWSISPPYTGPGACSVTGGTPNQNLVCFLGNLAPAVVATVHVVSSSSSAGTYANTAILSAGNSVPQIASATIQVIGAGPIASLRPSKVDFHNVYLKVAADAHVILANTGDAPMTISAITISAPGNDLADFRLTSSCPKSLAAGKSCKILVVCFPHGDNYSPTATLSITDDAPGSPQLVPLSATVINPQATFKPEALHFGGQTAGTTTPPKTVTLTNTGTTDLILRKISIDGDFAFAPGGTCSGFSTLAPKTQCTMNVTFSPVGKGKRIGCVTVNDNTSLRKHKVDLSGVGD
jgi:YVTN family beta-propeller protein